MIRWLDDDMPSSAYGQHRSEIRSTDVSVNTKKKFGECAASASTLVVSDLKVSIWDTGDLAYQWKESGRNQNENFNPETASQLLGASVLRQLNEATIRVFSIC